jgi:hypothetical protein
MKAKLGVALAFALTVAGCASGPYSAYDGGYYEGYRPYAYGSPYYDYPGAYYGYPGVIGGSIYYDRRDYDRDWRNRSRDDRDHWQGRGRDDRGGRGRDEAQPPRGRLDTRHGEAGNEAGM